MAASPTTRTAAGSSAYEGPEQIEHKMREVLAVDLLLIGRGAYESFAGAWPTYTGEFADRMNGMPKAVVSGTLTAVRWNNTTVLGGDAVPEVAAARTSTAALPDPRPGL